MEIAPRIFTARVMHKRLFPKVNQFTYGVYYLALPLPFSSQWADGWRFGVNRRAVLGFHDKDHGPHDGGALEPWARGILASYGLSGLTQHITLVTMPRVLGYGFNPVSFYLCQDSDAGLRAVICEVHNTFGETHSYLCAKPAGEVIGTEDWLQAEKLFHVSPFIAREGFYRFRFHVTPEALGVWIDYYDAEGRQQLLTALTGRWTPLTRASLRRAFWRHPLVTLKTIALIHWQAIKLASKGIRYIIKPRQRDASVSAPDNLTKW